MGVGRGSHNVSERWAPAQWAWLTLRKTPRPTRVMMSNLVAHRVQTYVWSPPGKSAPRFLPFKVTQDQETNTDLAATYDFILVFHRNRVVLSHTVSQINGDLCQKSQNFPNLVSK